MKQPQLNGLFINCVEAQDSIYASGKMAYDCLIDSEKYSLEYVEITKDNLTVSTNYDFYFFNYHFHTMSWLDPKSIKELLPGVKITMVLEVSPNDPFVLCSPDDFDIYCVLDPTLNIGMENVFAFPRPLEDLGEVPRYQEREIPLIGSFGLGTHGKGFEHLIDAVNMEFDRADVRINIPFAAYWDKGESYAKQLAQLCKDKAKSGIDVAVTHDYMTKPELIEWCSQNTINCFFYDRNIPGLAATTDQAISSGRPLLISKNNTFRHIQKFIKPFPYQSIREAIKTTEKKVARIQHEWSPQKFRELFEDVLERCHVEKTRFDTGKSITLRLKPRTLSDFVQPLRDKAAIRTRLKSLDKKLTLKARFKRKPKPLKSCTQFGDDVILLELLNEISIQNIRYLEIGAKDSNTKLFYERGGFGVLVESDPTLRSKLKADRPRDKIFSNAKSLNLDDMISNYFTECPDLISMNTDEIDEKVLKTINFALYNPAVFCMRNSVMRSEVCDFLCSGGYEIHTEASHHTVFVNRNLRDFCNYQKEHRF